MDYEQIQQEDALFPWLASDCMADQTCGTVESFEETDPHYLQCMGCDAFIDDDEITDEDTCPFCDHPCD